MRGATILVWYQARGSMTFQSTLLMRGATRSVPLLQAYHHHFNPRSSCEERPHLLATTVLVIIFQSTLLMRGATDMVGAFACTNLDFNPRSSCEERPSAPTVTSSSIAFQSTLLMRGATIFGDLGRLLPSNFNPRSSCEERRGTVTHEYDWATFQSTLLMRGATVSILGIDLPDFIIYFSRTYPFSPKMPTSRHLSCKLHFLCDGTSHFGDL